MGTNYYLRIKEKYLDECPRVVRDNFEMPEWHIGKCSYGWKFLFQEQIIEGEVVDTFEKWADFMKKEEYEIYDEYGRLQDAEELITLIKSKQGGISHQNLRYNYQSKDGYDFDKGDFS